MRSQYGIIVTITALWTLKGLLICILMPIISTSSSVTWLAEPWDLEKRATVEIKWDNVLEFTVETEKIY